MTVRDQVQAFRQAEAAIAACRADGGEAAAFAADLTAWLIEGGCQDLDLWLGLRSTSGQHSPQERFALILRDRHITAASEALMLRDRLNSRTQLARRLADIWADVPALTMMLQSYDAADREIVKNLTAAFELFPRKLKWRMILNIIQRV